MGKMGTFRGTRFLFGTGRNGASACACISHNVHSKGSCGQIKWWTKTAGPCGFRAGEGGASGSRRRGAGQSGLPLLAMRRLAEARRLASAGRLLVATLQIGTPAGPPWPPPRVCAPAPPRRPPHQAAAGSVAGMGPGSRADSMAARRLPEIASEPSSSAASPSSSSASLSRRATAGLARPCTQGRASGGRVERGAAGAKLHHRCSHMQALAAAGMQPAGRAKHGRPWRSGCPAQRCGQARLRGERRGRLGGGAARNADALECSLHCN